MSKTTKSKNLRDDAQRRLLQIATDVSFYRQNIDAIYDSVPDEQRQHLIASIHSLAHQLIDIHETLISLDAPF